MSEVAVPERIWADGKLLAGRDGPVGIVTFNQPKKHNAISLAMWDALGKIIAEFELDASIRAIVLRGAGDKAFSAGADIGEFGGARSGAELERLYEERSRASRLALSRCAKPTISCIRGYCLGGGLGIALSTDLRIAARDSRFGIPAARLGIAYPFEDLRALISLVGAANARYLLLTADRIDAEEARSIGLLNRVFDGASLWDATLALATRIAANAPLSITAARSGIELAMQDFPDRNMSHFTALTRLCAESLDAREGERAFLEKRAPVFVGR